MTEFINNFFEITDWIYKALPWLLIFAAYLLFKDFLKKHNKENTGIKTGNRKTASGIIFGFREHSNRVVYSPCAEEGHIAVFGGSGLGKTSALLIPTLKNWSGTSFTIDISGDICKNVEIPNKLTYEPDNPDTMPFNIFGAIDQITGEDNKNEALENLAFLLMPEDEKMADSAKFFHTEGRKILTASLIAFYHAGLDFIEIAEKVVSSSWKDLLNDIDNTKYDKAIQYINSFQGTSEQNTAGCKQTCDGILKLFATNERIKKTIRRPCGDEICFMPQILEQYSVFVIIEDAKLDLYAPLLHLITAQSLEYFSTRPNDATNMILFCLDEFASFGRMEITSALRKLRKKHIRIMMLTQSIPDIDLIYGRAERSSMMNNYRFKVLLGADDPDTQEYFAKMIGFKETTKNSISTSATNKTYTESEGKEWVIEPADLAKLDSKDKSLILLYNGEHLRLRKNYYFK